jgi:hypothetical protein
MRKLMGVFFFILVLSIKINAQNTDSSYQHNVFIQIDTLTNTSLNDFEINKPHWINFSFSNLPDGVEFKVESSYQVYRKGVKIFEENLRSNFLQSTNSSFQIESCIFLPNDSLNISLKYRIFNPWIKNDWSHLFTVFKGFKIESIHNYEYYNYFIEILCYENKDLVKPDRVNLTAYFNGKEYNPFIYIKDNKYFYENLGDSLLVNITSKGQSWKEVFNDPPKYGGRISCGVVQKEVMFREINQHNKKSNKFGFQLYRHEEYQSPYLRLKAKNIIKSADYLIMFRSCPTESSSGSFNYY